MNPTTNPTPTCRHLHTDGRPCGSPALRGEPFCFHHHTARKPMPKRTSSEHGYGIPQLPAPDDFPAIQRSIGEVLRLLAVDRLTASHASILLKGLAIASQNLARQHRREEKLAALGLLQAPVTDFLNHPTHGTLALAPNEAPAEAEAVPDPIPLLTPDASPATSFDQAKTVEMTNYFQAVDDKRNERCLREYHEWTEAFEEEKSLELEALYDDRLRKALQELEARFETQLQTQREAKLEKIPIQQNQDLTHIYEQELALAS